MTWKLALRAVAIAAGITWAWLCWRAFAAPESLAAREWLVSAMEEAM